MANQWINGIPSLRLRDLIENHGPALMEKHRTSDPHFAIWLETLDRACRRRTFMSYMDLEDWDYWSAYAGDMTPFEAVADMLVDNGYGEF